MLSVKGIFENGVAKPEQAVEGHNGQPVIITFVPEQRVQPASTAKSLAWDALLRLVETSAVATGIPDLAYQHDHYLHGKPKKE